MSMSYFSQEAKNVSNVCCDYYFYRYIKYFEMKIVINSYNDLLTNFNNKYLPLL